MPSQPATVLYAELPGFAELSVKLDPGPLQSLLGRVHELTLATLRLHQGHISHFSGDSYIAAFTPQKKGVSSEVLAIEACMEFRERLEILLEEMNCAHSAGYKAGIAAAEAIVTGLEDTGNVTVMGQAVTFATRLKDFAEKGQVLVDGNVFEQAKDRFDFITLEPLPVRGSKDALKVFELKGKKRAKLNLEMSSQRKIASEMVGRTNEMELVEGQVKKLLSGKGAVVNIVGKAGIGKSRLVAELMLQDCMEKVLVLEARALSMGQNLSFHPITHIIKSWAGITEEDPMAVSAEKLRQSILRIAPDLLEEIFPFLATMMGMPLSGEAKERVRGIEGDALEKLILKNLRDLITRAASVRPLIIMIEDMHWSDSSTITFLESLFKLSPTSPVMFINILRPGYEKTGDYMLKYLEENLREHHLNIFINALTGKESNILIENLLQKVPMPAEVNEVIIRKTEGNPFFIEEVIRSFIDEGVIEVKGEGFSVSNRIDQVNIPATINEVILSRVDKLDEKTKELLKTASVIGRNFYYKVLEEATEAIGELDERLAYLREVELISESNKKEEIEYLFKHALAQQATYESILLNSKKELHLKIARSIEKVFAGNIQEFYGTLAYHYEKAENWDRTEGYLHKAGEEAMQSGASHEAYHYLKKGLEIYLKLHPVSPEREKLADYYYNLSLACHRGGLNVEAIDNINKFQLLYLKQLPSNKFRLIFGLAWRLVNFLLAINFPKYYFKKKPTDLDDTLIKLFITKGESLVTVNPKGVFLELVYFSSRLVKLDLARTVNGLGLLMEYSGIFIWTGISLPLGKKVIHVVEKFVVKQKQSTWMKFRYDQIMYRLFSGDFTPDADEDEVFRIGIKSGAFWETTTYHMFSTYIHLERGDWRRSSETRQRLFETSEVFDNEHSRVQYYRMTGIAYSKFRRLDDVMENSAKAIDIISRTGHVTILMLVQCSRALALALRGEFSEADRYIEEAREIVITRKRGVIFYSTYLLTKIHLELAKIRSSKSSDYSGKEWKELIKTSKEAIKISKKFAGNLTEAYRLRGEALFLKGKPDKAIRYFEKAMDFGLKSGSRVELSRAFFEVGKLLSDPAVKQNRCKGMASSEYLEKARSMFEDMGLEWDLEQWRRVFQ